MEKHNIVSITEDEIDRAIDYWDKVRNSKMPSTKTVWSIHEVETWDSVLINAKDIVISYTFYDQFSNESMKQVTKTKVAKNGSVKSLWQAASDLYDIEHNEYGDHHYFIEGFMFDQKTGNFNLIMGS